MDRRSFLHRIAPIVVAPALALEALERAKGRSMVGWTRGYEGLPSEAWVVVYNRDKVWKSHIIVHAVNGDEEFIQALVVNPDERIRVPFPVRPTPWVVDAMYDPRLYNGGTSIAYPTDAARKSTYRR